MRKIAAPAAAYSVLAEKTAEEPQASRRPGTTPREWLFTTVVG